MTTFEELFVLGCMLFMFYQVIKLLFFNEPYEIPWSDRKHREEMDFEGKEEELMKWAIDNEILPPDFDYKKWLKKRNSQLKKRNSQRKKGNTQRTS